MEIFANLDSTTFIVFSSLDSQNTFNSPHSHTCMHTHIQTVVSSENVIHRLVFQHHFLAIRHKLSPQEALTQLQHNEFCSSFLISVETFLPNF